MFNMDFSGLTRALGELARDLPAKVVYPKIDQTMRRMGQDGVEEARRLVAVDTGQLKASISYIYDQRTRTVTLYADKPYAAFIEMGYRHRSGRIMPPRPFLAPALRVMGKAWGVTTAVQLTGLAPQYHARTLGHATRTKHFGKAKLILGHRTAIKGRR
jgi:hypothetical protein